MEVLDRCPYRVDYGPYGREENDWSRDVLEGWEYAGDDVVDSRDALEMLLCGEAENGLYGEDAEGEEVLLDDDDVRIGHRDCC